MVCKQPSKCIAQPTLAAEFCSAFQQVSVCASRLQCVPYCSVFQQVPVCFNILQCVSAGCSVSQQVSVCPNRFQCVIACCCVLHCCCRRQWHTSRGRNLHLRMRRTDCFDIYLLERFSNKCAEVLLNKLSQKCKNINY